jgi:hypothetical protein
MTDRYLQDLFSHLDDEDIRARIKNGLTPDAYEIACCELRSRGVEPPVAEELASSPEEQPYLGDMVILARDLDPTEAYILASCLASAGIYADPGDIDTARGSSLWSIAIGGAKVRVPQSQFAEAQKILEAFNRGEFALDDDFDTKNGIE